MKQRWEIFMIEMNKEHDIIQQTANALNNMKNSDGLANSVGVSLKSLRVYRIWRFKVRLGVRDQSLPRMVRPNSRSLKQHLINL